MRQLLALAILVLWYSSLPAQESFYQGKTLRVIVGSTSYESMRDVVTSGDAVKCGALPPTVGQADVDQVLRKELVEEAWLEVSQTEEVKRNLEKLQPVIERVGY